LLIEHLREQWRVRQVSGRVHDALSSKDDELVLGSGTLLAKAGPGPEQNALEGDDLLLRALLSVAYRRPIEPVAIGHVRAAARHWRKGSESQAELHLALSRLGRIQQPAEAARRLFMADGLMRAGVAPEAILEALGLDSSDKDSTLKYSPSQPRVPAGNGRPSGEWVAELAAMVGSAVARTGSFIHAFEGAEGGRSIATLIRSGARLDLGTMSTRALAALTEFIVGLAETGALGTTLAAGGTVATLGVIFIPSTGPRGQWVNVGGPGNISYYRNTDEMMMRFKYTSSDGKQHIFSLLPVPDGDYRDPDKNVVARLIKAGAHAGVIISTENLLGEDTGGPKLCPTIVKDNGGELGTAYEDYAKARLNPGNPTPHKMAYPYIDRATGRIVKLDDCEQKTGKPYEYKGPNYEVHFEKKDFIWDIMRANMLKQSMNQLNSTGPQPLSWVFAEKPVADEFHKMFKEADKGREFIKIDVWPWAGQPQ
jgi:hypothetical protein